MLRSFKRIPVELRRLAVVGVFVGVVVVAVFNSREDNLSTDAGNDGSTQPFRQSEGRQQAEGWFIPSPRVADLPESGMQRLANAVPLPRPRPNTPGFFTNWCDLRAMEKEITCSLKDDVFPKLICRNLVISQSDHAKTSRFGVSEGLSQCCYPAHRRDRTDELILTTQNQPLQ